MRDYGAHVYKLSAYYAGTPVHEIFQHNMQDYRAHAYKLSAYYDGTPTHYKIPAYYAESSYVKKSELQHIVLEYFRIFKSIFVQILSYMKND